MPGGMAAVVTGARASEGSKEDDGPSAVDEELLVLERPGKPEKAEKASCCGSFLRSLPAWSRLPSPLPCLPGIGIQGSRCRLLDWARPPSAWTVLGLVGGVGK